MPFQTIYTHSSGLIPCTPMEGRLTEEQYRIHLKEWQPSLSEEKIDAIIREDPRYTNMEERDRQSVNLGKEG